MTTYTYQHNTPSEAPGDAYRSPQVQFTGGTTSVTIRNGEVTTETEKNRSVSSRDLSAYAPDDWRSSAIKPNGFPATDITADTLITIGGTQGRVQDFVAAGMMVKKADGDFDMAEAESEVPEADQQDHTDAADFPDEIAQVMQDAAEPFPQDSYDKGVMQAMHAAVTGDGFDSVVRTLAMGSGLEPRDAEQRANFLYDQFHMQAERYVTKNGIAKEDLAGFYQFCREYPRDFADVLNRQVYTADLSSWKGLINRFHSTHAPSVQVLKANGFETRTHGDEPEVRIQGIWMSVKGATRAGFI